MPKEPFKIFSVLRNIFFKESGPGTSEVQETSVELDELKAQIPERQNESNVQPEAIEKNKPSVKTIIEDLYQGKEAIDSMEEGEKKTLTEANYREKLEATKQFLSEKLEMNLAILEPGVAPNSLKLNVVFQSETKEEIVDGEKRILTTTFEQDFLISPRSDGKISIRLIHEGDISMQAKAENTIESLKKGIIDLKNVSGGMNEIVKKESNS